MLQKARIDTAHARARAVLKFSSLVTDAYFHYTPSQIMLAALSLADRGLTERLVQGAFTPNQNATSNENGTDSTPRHDLRDKVMGAIEACREMLATEPPERLDEYWGTVSRSTSGAHIRLLLRPSRFQDCNNADKTHSPRAPSSSSRFYESSKSAETPIVQISWLCRRLGASWHRRRNLGVRRPRATVPCSAEMAEDSTGTMRETPSGGRSARATMSLVQRWDRGARRSGPKPGPPYTLLLPIGHPNRAKKSAWRDVAEVVATAAAKGARRVMESGRSVPFHTYEKRYPICHSTRSGANPPLPRFDGDPRRRGHDQASGRLISKRVRLVHWLVTSGLFSGCLARGFAGHARRPRRVPTLLFPGVLGKEQGQSGCSRQARISARGGMSHWQKGWTRRQNRDRSRISMTHRFVDIMAKVYLCGVKHGTMSAQPAHGALGGLGSLCWCVLGLAFTRGP